MKFFLISDNIDTAMGLRLAGVEGVVVHTEDEVKSAVESAMHSSEIALVLITERLMLLFGELIYGFKLNFKRPLIVQIPDRHNTGDTEKLMSEYIKNAIGVVM